MHPMRICVNFGLKKYRVRKYNNSIIEMNGEEYGQIRIHT